MGVGNPAHNPNFNPRQQEAFMVAAGNVNRGQQLYPHASLKGPGNRAEEHKAAAADLTASHAQNFGQTNVISDLDQTGRSDFSM